MRLVPIIFVPLTFLLKTTQAKTGGSCRPPILPAYDENSTYISYGELASIDGTTKPMTYANLLFEYLAFFLYAPEDADRATLTQPYSNVHFLYKGNGTIVADEGKYIFAPFGSLALYSWFTDPESPPTSDQVTSATRFVNWTLGSTAVALLQGQDGLLTNNTVNALLASLDANEPLYYMSKELSFVFDGCSEPDAGLYLVKTDSYLSNATITEWTAASGFMALLPPPKVGPHSFTGSYDFHDMLLPNASPSFDTEWSGERDYPFCVGTCEGARMLRSAAAPLEAHRTLRRVTSKHNSKQEL